MIALGPLELDNHGQWGDKGGGGSKVGWGWWDVRGKGGDEEDEELRW